MTASLPTGESPSIVRTRRLAAVASVLAMSVVLFVLFIADSTSNVVLGLFTVFVAAACVGVGVAMAPFVRRR